MGEDWDMIIENEKAVDVSLVLPHHRARTQPLDYRMNMHVAGEEGDMKVKVVSTQLSTKRWASNLTTSIVPSHDLSSICLLPPSRLWFLL